MFALANANKARDYNQSPELKQQPQNNAEQFSATIPSIANS